MIVPCFERLVVRQGRIELNADLSGGGGPLRPQVVRRADHHDTTGGTGGQIMMGNPKRKAGFPRRRCGSHEIVLARVRQHIGHGPSLPITKYCVPGGEGHRHLNTGLVRLLA